MSRPLFLRPCGVHDGSYRKRATDSTYSGRITFPTIGMHRQNCLVTVNCIHCHEHVIGVSRVKANLVRSRVSYAMCTF